MRRRVYIELPEEERKEGMCGLLVRSLYGEQEASSIWQEDYSSLMERNGFQRGKSNAAVFYDPVRDARGMVHGDDFWLLAVRASLDEVDGILKSRYECKCLGYLGFEEDDKR